jgi:hypothetical protein
VMQPVFSAAGLNGPSTYTVHVRVTDEFGASDIATAAIDVLNVSPTVTLTGSATANEGQFKHYSFTTSDPDWTHSLSWPPAAGFMESFQRRLQSNNRNWQF